MLRRLAIGLAAAGALPEPPFVCDNTQCRVKPRNASAAPICAAGYYTCASCCDEDADCNCDGHGGDAYDHAWRTPKCPEGYYECGDCCDRDADCACDDQCERFRAPSCFRRERWKGERQYRPCNSDLPANVDCSLAYHENASKPHGWCPVGYHDCGQHDCCDWNSDCACDGAWRTGNLDEHCDVGPTGHDGALWGFECSVHKGLDDPPASGLKGLGATEAGACCAGPNETAACADGYTVVAGDAPCVFTCCEGAVDNLTTAADVDAEGFCWEAHANEGRRPVEWGDCCESECGLFVAGPRGRGYDDAVAYCSRIGAEIATIYSATENELARHACGGSCWIGLEEVGGDASTPKASQTWRWRDGSTASYTNWEDSYTNWEDWEPNNYEGNDERNAIIHDGMWYDVADDHHMRPLCRTGDGTSACRTVYLPEGRSHGEFAGFPPQYWEYNGIDEVQEWRRRAREEWFREETCRPKADAPAACFAPPTRRADCVDGACRALKPGGAALDRFVDDYGALAVTEDCHGITYEFQEWRWGLIRRFGPQSRHCADNHTLAGVDYVDGVGTCCTNRSSDDAKCVAPAPECFHRSGPRRCDILLKYFGSMDYDGEHARTPPCDFRGEPYACDDLRCDPASGALYYVREDSWRWWGRLWSWNIKRILGDHACMRNWWRADLRRNDPWPASRKNRRMGERQRIQACGVVTEDGDFFHAQLAGGRGWDEAWLYRTGYANHEPHRGHPWDNFWASTRAPRRWRGLDAAPTTAAADACARAAAREFHGGCLGTCGKTCAELGHDPVLFEKLRAAVKKWPDKGGGDAIPDACGFASQPGVAEIWYWWSWHRILYNPHIVTWITARQIVAWLGLGLIYVVGVAAACCASQPACLGYAHLQRLRNWVNRRIEDGGAARYCYFICCGGWLLELVARLVALLFAGLEFCRLLLRPGEARARYEKFRERRPWFRRYVAPCLDKLSAGVASFRKKRAVAALLAKLSVAAPLAWKGLKKAWKGLKKGTARLGRCLYCCCCGDFWRRLLVKRPPAAVYTAEDGTEQTVPWVVAPGPPGTIVTRPDGIKVKVPEGVQRGQLFSLAEAAPAGDDGAAPKHAAEPPSLTERTALLVRKAWIIKKRTTGALAKQVFVPLLGVGVLWLLYDTRERNRKERSTKASAGFDTIHGDLELVVFQFFFFPWVQVVASALVGDVAQGTREATRAAGGADAAYWLASFLVEGVAVGGGVAVAIAAGAAPGLFRRAGKSFEVAAFFELFALHWLFLLALVLQTFVVVTCLLRSQIAAAGLPPLLHAALHGFYLLWNPLRAWNRHRGGRLRTHWTLTNRPRAHFVGAAFLPQFAYDLLVDSFSPTGKRAGWRCRLVADGFVGERYPCGKCRKECWEKAPGPRLGDFEQYLQSRSLTAAPCADEHLMCEDVWPFWYEKTEDRGWRPESSWTAGVYCMLMVSVVFWAAVLWYVIQVSTSAARGKGKDLLFCIRKAYWRPPPPDEVVEKAPLVDHDEWFENDESADAPVQVRGLRKVFGKKVAVSDATFAIRDSEIFCLLGHNGAGKTTTMSMMTGAMAPDGGSANFFGIRTLGPLAEADGLDRLRQLLGFCPQHDAMFPQLTLREHLIFYSRLKGVEEARAENEASGLLQLFRLTEMAEGFPLKLSGGQKRKVMMAAALTGGSRLVVLDEPTAGMDPVARREVWTLLRDVRVDRSVLLTTHHMEEAEALADRVAIMAAGSVTCCGTISFLKRHFGGGDDAEVAARRKAAEEEARRKEAEAKALAERMAAAGAEERERLAAEKARLEREAAEARAKAEGGADTSTGGLHVAVTTAVAARDRLKAIFAQHVPGAKLAAASKLEEDLRRATEKDAANPLLGSTPKSFSSSFKSPLLNATRGASFSASRNWADAEAPLLEDSARDVTTTYTIHASRARVAALFEGLEAEADGLGLVDVSVTATSLEDVFIAVGEQVEGAAAPVEAETLVGGALLPSAPGEPVPAGRLVAAVVQFRLQQIRDDLVWIKKFVLGGAALPGGLKQAVARARASKDHTTFTVPTKFAVLVAALAGAPTLGVAVGVQGGGWLGLGLWFATSVAFSAVVFLLAALECGVRYYCFKSSVSAPCAVAGGVVGAFVGMICVLVGWEAVAGPLTSMVATAIAVGLEAGLRPYFGSPTSVFGAIVGMVAGLSAGWGVGWQVCKAALRRWKPPGRRARARTEGGVAGFFVGLVVEVLGSVFASAFCSAGIHGSILVLLQVAAAAMPLVVRAQMPGKGKRAFGFKSRYAEYYNTLVAGVLVGAYFLVAGFVVEPYVRERARGLRNLLAVSGLDTLTYWLGNWLSDALVLVGGAVCVVFMLAATRMAYRKRLCSSAPTYAQLHAAARKGDLDLGPYNATTTSLATAFHDRYPGGFEEDQNGIWSSESYDTIKQWYCGSVWDRSIGAGAWQNATKYVVRRWMERWPWLWILLPLCSAGIVSFSHFATTTFDSPLIAVASTPIFIGLLGGAAPAGLAGLWWVATTKPDQLLYQEFFCKIGWLASIATPFGNLAIQVCKVAFHPQLKRGGFLEASGPGPLSRQPADPPLPSGGAAVFFALFHIILYEGIVVFKDRRALRPLAWVKTRVSKVRANAMPDDVAAERARVAALTGAGDAASAGDALSTNEDDFQIVVDEPEEEAPPSRPPPTSLSTAVRDTVAMLRNVPPGDDPYPPSLSLNAAPADRDGLVVSDLRKIYPPRFFGGAAVESVQCAAFGVPTGQVFGLLGANGAGKTTTVSMVCRAVEPTSGDAKVAGKSVLADFEDAAKALGVVNQKNVLWDHLSCRDHLCLFARLRGVDIEGDARHAAEQALAVVGLSDHADKAAGRLSGGMKRKLAVAVALVGGPSVVLLDEPSSGLDPGAQRNLWDLIKVTMKGRAVVLTTHSMGEADLLCDRLGIMVKGTMRCIGTPQELKERYAAGYEISCRLETRDDAHVADLVAFAREAFSSPDVDVAAADADIATLELAGVDPRRTPALAFRAFDDDACARLGVIDFSLARATMEKVFLRIAGGEEGLAQSRLGREIAEMLQAEADDDAQKELDKVVFSEATSCGCTRFAWDNLCFHSFAWFFFFTGLWMVSALVPQRFDTCVWWEHHESKGHLRRCGRHDYWFKAPTMFYYSPMGLLVGISLMGWTMFCHPCAVWCLRAPSRTGAVAPA